MLICIAGKNDISVDVLSYLYKNNVGSYELCVLCNRTETGKNSWQKSLRFFAKQNEIKEYQLEDLYEIDNLIFLSLEYDTIVKPKLFKEDARLYNIHFSLLPQYKGMYTSAMPILNGEKYVGATFHKIDSGIDTGDIIAQRKFKCKRKYTSRDLYLKYIENGVQLVIENIDKIIAGKEIAYIQSKHNASYYSQKSIDYTNIVIDLKQTADNISRQIRAFAFREYQMPKILEHSIIACRISNIKSRKKPGTILFENEYGIMLATIDYNVFLYYDRFDELLETCKRGDIDSVVKICSVREHVNQKNEKGWSPLIIATYYNRVEIVKYLISVGGEILVQNNNGTNLLMYAKDAYLQYGNIELIYLYRSLGISAYQEDYMGNNTFYYIEKAQMTNEQYCDLKAALE